MAEETGTEENSWQVWRLNNVEIFFTSDFLLHIMFFDEIKFSVSDFEKCKGEERLQQKAPKTSLFFCENKISNPYFFSFNFIEDLKK